MYLCNSYSFYCIKTVHMYCISFIVLFIFLFCMYIDVPTTKQDLYIQEIEFSTAIFHIILSEVQSTKLHQKQHYPKRHNSHKNVENKGRYRVWFEKLVNFTSLWFYFKTMHWSMKIILASKCTFWFQILAIATSIFSLALDLLL